MHLEMLRGFSNLEDQREDAERSYKAISQLSQEKIGVFKRRYTNLKLKNSVFKAKVRKR